MGSEAHAHTEMSIDQYWLRWCPYGNTPGGDSQNRAREAKDGHTFNPNTRWQRQMDLCEFRASLVYMVFQNSQGYAERI